MTCMSNHPGIASGTFYWWSEADPGPIHNRGCHPGCRTKATPDKSSPNISSPGQKPHQKMWMCVRVYVVVCVCVLVFSNNNSKIAFGLTLIAIRIPYIIILSQYTWMRVILCHYHESWGKKIGELLSGSQLPGSLYVSGFFFEEL